MDTLIIVLGSQNDARGELTPMGKARLECALQAYQARPGARLILTGGVGRFNPTPRLHAEHAARYIIGLGLPPGAILAKLPSDNTVEDGIVVFRYLAGSQVIETGRLLVITSALHVPRSRLIFEHFFAPERLEFLSAPDRVDEPRRLALVRHEEEAVASLIRQGGIYLDGKLIKKRS